MMTATITQSAINSPIGWWLIEANEEGLTRIDHYHEKPEVSEEAGELVLEAKRQLEAYFDGEHGFFDLPLAPEGTEFQKKVWEQLMAIPLGSTWSYQQLAEAIGDPNAMRAVGAANGKNPLPIIIPCHRVIGKDGSLTGYAGGIDIKRFLLEFEGALPESLKL